MASAVALLLSASGPFVATSHAQANPPVLPPDANHYGKSYGEWSAAYWQWLFSLPQNQNPLRDGDQCLNGANGQTGPVWFLADNGGGVSVRNCSVPAGKALFLMVLAGECSTLESPPFHGDNEAELQACIQGIVDQVTVVTCEVDGVPLQGLSAYRVQSPPFAFTLPDNNFLNLPAGTGLSVSDGYFVMLSPLPQGQHTLHVHSELPAFSFVLDITHHLTVEGPPAQALQPEVLYAFQLGPRNPVGSLVEGNDGSFYGTTAYGGDHALGTVFRVTTNGLVTALASFTRANGVSPEAGLVLGSDGNFYGTTSQGGSRNGGTVFQITTNGVLTTLVWFTGTNGWNPQAKLLLGSDGNFYGTTYGSGSGSNGNGTVFRVTTSGVLTTLVSFNNANGARPKARLVQGNDGDFYGTTEYGGSGAIGLWAGSGTVFRMTPNGELTSLISFTGTNGRNPRAGLVLGNDSNFYGTTARGGQGDRGTVFRVTTNGVLTSLVSFTGTNGGNPQAELVLGSDGDLFGTTGGTAFRVTTNGVLATLISFNGANGEEPQELVLGNDGYFYGTTYGGGSSDLGTVFKMTLNGVLTTLVSFADPDGASPNSKVAWGSDGNLYGTTAYGGSYNAGTVFRLTTNGLLTSLVSFNTFNRSFNYNYDGAGLVLGRDGNLYGTTSGGGNTGRGSVIQVTTNGLLTTLVSFDGANGMNPNGLALGNDGNFYGTTAGRWLCDCPSGSVFHVTTNGVLTTLVEFTGPNGAFSEAGLVLGVDSNFYGTTAYGGSNNVGTVFRVTTNGTLTTLVSFTDTDGRGPNALVLGSDGNFYGTTKYGGSGGYGTVFTISPLGVLRTLVSFNHENGANPQGALVSGRDGNFYGTTFYGGSSDRGTLFQVTTNGVLTTLIWFNGDNGAHPQAGLVLGRDGYFYGTTLEGGPRGGGTIFRLVISSFTSVVRQPGGSLLLTGTGPANGAYRLWASPDLSLPLASWTPLTSASFDGNGNFSYMDASASTNTSRFYQISVP